EGGVRRVGHGLLDPGDALPEIHPAEQLAVVDEMRAEDAFDPAGVAVVEAVLRVLQEVLDGGFGQQIGHCDECTPALFCLCWWRVVCAWPPPRELSRDGLDDSLDLLEGLPAEDLHGAAPPTGAAAPAGLRRPTGAARGAGGLRR